MVYKTEWGWVERKTIDDQNTLYFSGFDEEQVKRRAKVFQALCARLDSPPDITCESAHVPYAVAVKGKPAMAAYAFSIQLLSPAQIGEQFGITESTVKQYLLDLRKDRR